MMINWWNFLLANFTWQKIKGVFLETFTKCECLWFSWKVVTDPRSSLLVPVIVYLLIFNWMIISNHHWIYHQLIVIVIWWCQIFPKIFSCERSQHFILFIGVHLRFEICIRFSLFIGLCIESSTFLLFYFSSGFRRWRA